MHAAHVEKNVEHSHGPTCSRVWNEVDCSSLWPAVSGSLLLSAPCTCHSELAAARLCVRTVLCAKRGCKGGGGSTAAG